ncbi:MAG TPA: isochorismatase family protein [Mycobacteriales bacterium]|nr:isochorismatase family protein [Mycobacteriales bacterium]
MLTISARRKVPTIDSADNRAWRSSEQQMRLDPERTAALLCDVWDRHWCPSAERRLEALVPTIDRVVEALRGRGVLIVHAPSETMDHYAHDPARQRIRSAVGDPPRQPDPEPAPEMPVVVGRTHGCDASIDAPAGSPWTRQHSGIGIDQERDVISDDGSELAEFYGQRQIDTVIVMGVHTNMCILNRTFAIRALVRQGFQPLLVRDLTDAMYDPADPPYVTHDEGTRLVIEYIEKFFCPTITSAMLLD